MIRGSCKFVHDTWTSPLATVHDRVCAPGSPVGLIAAEPYRANCRPASLATESRPQKVSYLVMLVGCSTLVGRLQLTGGHDDSQHSA